MAQAPKIESVFPVYIEGSDGRDYTDDDFRPWGKARNRLRDDDDRYETWKFKLGALLKEQINPQEKTKWYLATWPAGYQLREPVDEKSKDVYLYGHPLGARRYFRSARDFLPHLLWLAGGQQGESNQQCACKICSKEDAVASSILGELGPNAIIAPTLAAGPAITPAAPGAKQIVPKKAAATASKVATLPVAAASPPRKVTPVPVPTNHLVAQAMKAAVPQEIKPAAAKTAKPAPKPVKSTTIIPPPTPVVNQVIKPTVQPQSDASYVFREGEVVWYKMTNAWRIGLILKVSNEEAKCLVQPLAHPYYQTENTLKDIVDMRPFLAFSVPPVNMPSLKGQTMHQVNWAEVIQSFPATDQQTQQLLALEASKMAVSAIDHSYSLFNPVLEAPQNPAIQFYGGAFFGAEKICVGEPVRIRHELDPNMNKLPVVMVLREIFTQQSAGIDKLFLSGDVWRLEETNNPSPAPNQNELPPVMLREKAFRDQVKQKFGIFSNWINVSPQQPITKDESQIRGRFYETDRLMRILDLQTFTTGLANGVVGEVDRYLNNRGESPGNNLGRRKNRVEALAGSAHGVTFLSFGPEVLESN